MDHKKCNGAKRAPDKFNSINANSDIHAGIAIHNAGKPVVLKRLLCLLLSLLLVFSLGCGKKQEPPVDTPAPLPTSTPLPTATPYIAPAVEVKQTVAYYFPSSNGPGALYGGIEFTNTGKVPLVISEAKFTFKAGKRLAEETVEPLVYKSDILAPGETSNLAVWVEYTEEAPEGPITLTAELTPQASSGTVRTLRISNPFIADNYPAFSTISGTLENPAVDMDYDLSLVYFSFYDENDKLLGVWHFTKDLAIPSEESRNFVMHMRSLPIPGLGKLTKRIVTRGIGF